MKQYITSEIIRHKVVGSPLSDRESKNLISDMLSEFDEFCKEKGLTYYLADGTLLGAVRHKGFIPWDDDADIYMMRDDYNKFINFAAFGDYYEIVSPTNHTSSIYHPFPYCNLFDKRTLMISNTMKHNTGKGQFIDVFPIDAVPHNYFAKKFLFLRLNLLDFFRRCSVYKKKKGKGIKGLITNCVKTILLPLDGEKIAKHIDRVASSYSNNESEYVGLLVCSTNNKVIFRRIWYSEKIQIEFEGRYYSAPKEYNLILENEYQDYMTLPPKEQQIANHETEVFWICSQ